jgi:hypothetical protein
MPQKLQNLRRAEWDVDMMKENDQEKIQKQYGVLTLPSIFS